MISNIIFGPERISRRPVEGSLINPESNLERLNIHQSQSDRFGKSDSETKIDALKSGTDVQSVLGRSQVKPVFKNPKPIILSPADESFLKTLNVKKYGFHPNGKSFWVHSKDGLGDGKIKNGQSENDFIKGLINDDVKAITVAGADDGRNSTTILINNAETGKVKMYTGNDVNSYSLSLTLSDTQTFKDVVYRAVGSLDNIYGATVWE